MAALLLGNVRVDLDRRQIERPSGTLKLTGTEDKLLRYLAARAGQVISREELLEQVWGYKPGVQSRAVDHTIRRVRTKIEADPANPAFLKSAYGHGYSLELPPQPGSVPAPPSTAGAVDPLFGRDALLSTLHAALAAGAPMLTLAGPPGIGKTRLGRALLQHTRRQGARAAWFCDLRAVHTADQLADQLAQTLGLADAEPSDNGPMHEAGLALAARGPALLVLDNCEQLDEQARQGVAAWRTLAPAAALVCTSREPLGCPDEQLHRVPGLPQDAAESLFLARANQVEPGAVQPGPHVSRLVKHLDCLPLALELAASAVDLLPLDALLARLEAGWMPSGGRDHHASLDVALDSSWRVLSAPQQRVLASASVFHGGFLATDLEAIAGADTLACVRILRRRSLIEGVPGAPGRFQLLQVVQDFIRTRMNEVVDRDQLLRAHAARFAAHGQRCRADAHGPDAPAALERLRVEQRNLTAALGRMATRDTTLMGELALSIACLTDARGPIAVGTHALSQAHSTLAPDSPVSLRRAVAFALVESLRLQNRSAEAAAILHTIDPGEERAQWALAHARVALEHSDADAAETWLERAQSALPPPPAERRLRARIAHARGNLNIERGDVDQAHSDYVIAANGFRQVGDTRALAGALSNLGNADLVRRRFAEAEARYRESLALHRANGDICEVGVSEGNLGNLHYDRGDLDGAAAAYSRAIEAHQQSGRRRFECVVTVNAGSLALARGQFDEARRLLGDALVRLGPQPNPRTAGFATVNLGMIAHHQGRLGDALARYSQAKTHFDQADDALGRTLVNAFLGVLAADQGDLAGATARLAHASATADPSLQGTIRLLSLAPALFRGDADAAATVRAAATENAVVDTRLAADLLLTRLGARAR